MYLKMKYQNIKISKYQGKVLRNVCFSKSKEIVKLLLDVGFDNNEKDEGRNMLIYSVYEIGVNLLKLFLEEGFYINSVNNYGWASLHWAIFSDIIDIIYTLLYYGSSTNIIINDSYKTPLHFIIQDLYLEKKRNIILLKNY